MHGPGKASAWQNKKVCDFPGIDCTSTESAFVATSICFKRMFTVFVGGGGVLNLHEVDMFIPKQFGPHVANTLKGEQDSILY